jgi:hypothetical protein
MVSMLATTVPSMPAIDISKLAALDERTSAPPRTPAAAAAFALPSDAFAPPPTAAPPASSAPRASSASGTSPHLLSQAFKPPPEAGELGEEELVVERSTRAIRLANQFRNAEVPEPDAPRAARSSRSSLRAPSSPPARESRSSLRTPSSPPARASQSSLRAALSASASGSSTRVDARPARSSLLVLALVAAVAIAIFATVVLRH